MRRLFLASRLPPPAFCILLSAFCLLISSCSSAPLPDSDPIASQLVYLLIDSSGNFQPVAQPNLPSPFSLLPFSFPPNCSVYHLYPNPATAILAVEFLCGDGPAVLFYDLQSGESFNPAETLQTDARFLAWSADGRSLYLKTDTLGSPQIVRFDRTREQVTALDLPEMVYDLAALPDGRIVYSFTQGIGFGSETWLGDADGSQARQVLAEPLDIIAYLRPSPDGSRIAFILMPDSQVPFTVGGLWVMNADGTDVRFLAEADAGHGYAPAWSPDGTQIAFVVRENPDDPQADLSAGALLSNVYRIEIRSGALTRVTTFTDAIAGTPVWSPDGSSLFFNVVRNGTIQIWVDDGGALEPLSDGMNCCAVWVPGK